MSSKTLYSLKARKENAHFSSIYCCDWIRWDKYSKSDKNAKDYIVTGSLDNLVKVWMLYKNKLQLLRVLRGHNMGVVSVSISRGYPNIVTASLDSHIIYWRLLTGKKIVEIPGQTGIWKVVFGPDGYEVATGGSAGIVSLYNCCESTVIKSIDTRSTFITSMAWSPNGKYIVTGSSTGVVCVINVQHWQLTRTIEAHTQGIRDIAFAPYAECIITASKDGYAKMFDVYNGDCQGKLQHDMWVESVCYTPDGMNIVTGTEDGTVRIATVHYDVNYVTYVKILHTFHEHSSSVSGVCFAKKGTHLLSVSKDRSINVYNCLPPKKD